MRFRLCESIEYDSEGNPLTEEQVRFFRNSQIRDNQGRLLVCYHGAKNGGFNVFDARDKSSQFGKYKFGRNVVNFFTTDKETALGYTDIGVEENGNVYSVYLNITNPYILTSERADDITPNSWNNIKNKNIRERQIRLFDKFWRRWKWLEDDDEDTIERLNDDLSVFNCELRYNGSYFDLIKLEENTKFGRERKLLSDYSIEELFDPYMYDDLKEAIIGEDDEDYLLTTNDIVRHVLDMNKKEGTDYDGIIVKDIIDVGPTGSPWTSLPQNTIITIEDSNQIKSVTNKTPTSSANINESIIEQTDSEGNQLSKEQIEFFKNSKVRDSQGRLLVVYHGTKNQFSTFNTRNPKKYHSIPMQLDFGSHFTVSREDARLYGWNVLPCYLNITNPYIEKNPYQSEITLSGMEAKGYDGVFYTPETHHRTAIWDKDNKEIIGYKSEIDYWADSFIAFNTDQIKSIDNKTPTSSDNINENKK